MELFGGVIEADSYFKVRRIEREGDGDKDADRQMVRNKQLQGCWEKQHCHQQEGAKFCSTLLLITSKQKEVEHQKTRCPFSDTHIGGVKQSIPLHRFKICFYLVGIYVSIFVFIAVQITSFLPIFLSHFLPLFIPVPLPLASLSVFCWAVGSDIARSIPTRRCISSISSFCFVKQQFNQCLVFPTHRLDKSWQLPSLLVREPEECRN